MRNVRAVRSLIIGAAKYFALPAVVLGLCVSVSHAQLIHRYSFTSDATDSVGGANGSPVSNPGNTGGTSITFSGGQMQLGNPNFYGPSGGSNPGNYLALPPNILPSSGSATIEEWFTFGGSGFFTESYTFSNNMNDTNPPGASNGQYLMGVISAPQGGPVPAGGGSHISQSLAGYGGGAETDAFGTTPGIGAGGGGYLDDGGTYMTTTVIDGAAGTLSYYINGVLQQSIPAISLSSYAFTNAYIGRSAFAGDNYTNGSVDEFRIYGDAESAAAVLASFVAGPNTVVPEPSSLVLAGLGLVGLVAARRRNRK